MASVIGGGFFILCALILWIIFLLIEVPSIDNFARRNVDQSTKIYDQTGEVLLWEIHGEERRTIIPFEKISKDVKNATIAIEDSSFYSHHGFSPASFFRVIFLNAFRGKKIGSGGSTITQQLVKNTLLTPEQTVTRKIKEIIIAIKLEAVYSKDEILNLYLNQIPYGSNAYGIEAAAQTYFGKSAENLSLAEAAYLAALPKAPSYYSPYGNHGKELEQRKNLVLEQMRGLRYINDEEFASAKNKKIDFLPQKKNGIRAPHFVMYVREYLNEKFGEDVVERGGLTVVTTLDSVLQEKAEEIVARKVAENVKKFNASNAGLVALDPKTGRILAMVGSRDYFDVKHEGNFNIALARRQPGSAFKPIVYATAFKEGYTPETVVFDLETNFAAAGKPYIPQNFDEKFRGPVTLREALAQSLNVPGVKTLYLSGVQESIDTARDFGISTLTDPSRYGLTLVLGGGEVTLLELTSAYGVFANQGIRADKHAIIQIKDKNNTVLEDENIISRRVIDENVANTINSVLSDNGARTPLFGARSPLYFESGNVAVKTGTTNDYRDAWTVGYSPTVVVGAWAGNNDNSPMVKNVAGFIIAPLWREFMEAALAPTPQESFSAPKPSIAEKPVLRGIWRGSESYFIDRASGKRATEFTPDSQKEERIIQQIHSILYWVSKNDPDGPRPERPENDPQFYGWEAPVRAWAEKMQLIDDASGVPINEYDTSHSPENWPKIEFPETEQNKIFSNGETLEFRARITTPNQISEVSIFIDDEFVRSEKGVVDTVAVNQDALGLESGSHTLTLKVYDSIGNKQEKSILFTIAVL